LNAINPESFQKLIEKLPDMLNNGGRVIAVIMPRLCAWETLYFVMKFRLRSAFRRFTSDEVVSEMGDEIIKTWYYNPGQVKKWARHKFRMVDLRPVGFALPPSNFEILFNFRQPLLMKLNRLEKRLQKRSIFARWSDYYIIDLKLR
jgi:hypothetical protein